MNASPSAGKGSRQMSGSATAGPSSAWALLSEEEESARTGGEIESESSSSSASAGGWEEEREDDGAEGTDWASQAEAREPESACSRWERGLTSTEPPSISWSPVWFAEGVPVEDAAAKYTTKEDLRKRCSAFLLESPLIFAGTADSVPPEKSADTHDASSTSSRASTSPPTSKASVTIVNCTRRAQQTPRVAQAVRRSVQRRLLGITSGRWGRC